jgi:hypothetical protein
MTPRILQLLALCATGFGALAHAHDAATVSPQSLAGDWEYVMVPTMKLVLHLQVDPSGALSGSVDTPDSPPKHIELTNVHLAGSMLNYSMGSQPAIYHEVISADTNKMLGPHMWVRVGAVKPVAAAPAVPLNQLAGDWESPPSSASGAAPRPSVLRLRLDSGGSLTGTIDAPEPVSVRIKLSNVQVTGRTLSYSLSGGNRFQGALSSDGKTVTETSESTVVGTWHHVRTAAQAEAHDAAERSRPINGTWNGTGNYTTSFPGMPPSTGQLQLTFHFAGDPEVCSVDFAAKERTDTWPCQLTLVGNSVRLEALRRATFQGTLNADGTHLNGAFMMGGDWHWTGPMQINLTRATQPVH